MAPENAERFAAVLDQPQAFRPGDELPLLWHWAYFAEIVGQSGLGADGHPFRSDALAERFPRRMAAGGSVDRRGPLRVGRPATRYSHLEEITEKQGRTGTAPLCGLAPFRRAGGPDRTGREPDAGVPPPS